MNLTKKVFVFVSGPSSKKKKGILLIRNKTQSVTIGRREAKKILKLIFGA